MVTWLVRKAFRQLLLRLGSNELGQFVVWVAVLGQAAPEERPKSVEQRVRIRVRQVDVLEVAGRRSKLGGHELHRDEAQAAPLDRVELVRALLQRVEDTQRLCHSHPRVAQLEHAVVQLLVSLLGVVAVR